MMERHLATLWEAVADAVPDATAIVHGNVRRSYREWDEPTRVSYLLGALCFYVGVILMGIGAFQVWRKAS